MGDLVILIECPNGQTTILHQQGGGGTQIGMQTLLTTWTVMTHLRSVNHLHIVLQTRQQKLGLNGLLIAILEVQYLLEITNQSSLYRT